ncbi:DUF6379 domain-containing protein [Lysobacter korlensis]|uniref:C-deglycosylation enzyme beta subunit n=1 Tax=Lysobacter korlensis TaxID=553636 RepID=A0ABV6RX62_9GAMM
MGFDQAMLSEGGLTGGPGGYVLTLRLPWMRSLPWSCVEEVDVALDGQSVNDDALAFEVDGALVAPQQLSGRWQDYWVVGRPVRLHIRSGPAVPTGRRVRVDLTLRLRIPYLILGPAGPLVLPVRASRELQVRGATLEGATK